MLRTWIGSFVAVALVVGAILHFTGRKEPVDPAPPPDRRLPPPLEEKEIRTYLKVWPEVTAQLEEWARGFKPGQQPSSENQAQLDAILLRHHLDRPSFDLLRRRVEYVVDVLRWEEGLPAQRRKLEEEKARNEEFLKAAQGPTRDKLLEQQRGIEQKLAETPPPIHDSDRKLIRRFWAELDRVVPGQGSGKKPN